MSNPDSQETRAKSRISASTAANLASPDATAGTSDSSRTSKKRTVKKHSEPIVSLDIAQVFSVEFFQQRMIYFVLTGGLWFLLILLFSSVSPTEVANWGVYNSYLPVVVLVAASMFSLGKGLFQKAHSAVLFSSFFTLLLFFKLQHVIISWQLLLVMILIFGLIEGIFRLVFRK